VVPRGSLVVLRNRDVPGVIGRVGTVLGNAGINIAEYHQSRIEAGGAALAAIGVDGKLGPDVMDTQRALPEVYEVRQVHLGPQESSRQHTGRGARERLAPLRPGHRGRETAPR